MNKTSGINESEPMKAKPEIKPYEKNPHGYILIQSVTLARIPLAIIFSIVLQTSEFSVSTLIWCAGLLLLIEATDLLDGIFARRHSLVSEYGAMLDPFADSLSRLIIYWSLSTQGLVLFLVPLCMAIRDITVAYARILLAKKNQSVSARSSGKIKATVQAVGSFLLLFGPVYWNITGDWTINLLSGIIITVTLLSAVEYVRDAVLSIKD
jgi:CDP-diacylglycerol--glycerol-3-phosphate 3-phosphatidyltransferase